MQQNPFFAHRTTLVEYTVYGFALPTMGDKGVHSRTQETQQYMEAIGKSSGGNLGCSECMLAPFLCCFLKSHSSKTWFMGLDVGFLFFFN